MIRFCIILFFLTLVLSGCKAGRNCPAYDQALTEKQIKKNKKKSGKSYGLFTNKINKTSGYKNRKASKKEKKKTKIE